VQLGIDATISRIGRTEQLGVADRAGVDVSADVVPANAQHRLEGQRLDEVRLSVDAAAGEEVEIR
jgi:hypothetical protein